MASLKNMELLCDCVTSSLNKRFCLVVILPCVLICYAIFARHTLENSMDLYRVILITFSAHKRPSNNTYKKSILRDLAILYFKYVQHV